MCCGECQCRTTIRIDQCRISADVQQSDTDTKLIVHRGEHQGCQSSAIPAIDRLATLDMQGNRIGGTGSDRQAEQRAQLLLGHQGP